MVRVISLPNPRLAQAFVDYMATRGVQLELEPREQDVVLWLPDDAKLPQVERELEQFMKEPLHPRYQAASWHSGTTDSGLRYARFGYLQNLRQQAGPLTIGISVICIVVYLLMLTLGDNAVMTWLAWPAGSDQYFQVWRWISHAFLHFSPLHIIFNLMWWWYLGGQVEKRLGGGKLLQIMIVSAFMSGWAQSLFSGVYFGGLSGVVYALMGYVWWCGERAPGLGIGMPRGLMVFALLWLVAGHFGLFGMSIANAAHIAGLIIGLLMGFWDMRHARRQH
ncbi:rhomboid family intramembrane serine protease GlpG [Enterobacillus tribolii]|uniref:Rhomboid protease GlpG n=1 Tax=Enterobacillus tribolii TaxID=1487935 RepID=A0A370QTY0_9GAMM|nr:rhomboid family intramembrane serine protease GlpG [Enterobacillus tribolii]MBW7981224.1 rhomboid family intramembrane serine protease GlpG [Enterobacillus tribolii]RDK92716.1 GlpG protein [Enterobacillus tribolii]